ncbi:hypothetical protein E2C01_022668 [Portunus trituberculatus]|uniref:Uncharacterized protein n=1 Tax=Portunus trituberculatus TaxID=210409 RepID=A0A5B7E6M3_PORTR|nr:hypothetical protein [Portunus trituberculatus]
MEVNGYAGAAGRWREEVLQLAMVNTMDQWVKDNTMLDQVFTEKLDPSLTTKYRSLMGKSHHVVLEVELEN